MKNECSIIRDLLPLYIDDLVSADTADFVEEHLGSCEDCSCICRKMKEPDPICLPVDDERDMTPLTNIKKKLAAQKVKIALLTVVFAVTVLVSLFAILSTPRFFPYSEDLLHVVENADGSAAITFNQMVTNYKCTVSTDDEQQATCYFVDAWSSTWDRWFSDRGTQSFAIHPEENCPVVVYYSQNNGREDVLLYRSDASAAVSAVMTLPRMVLGYYLLIAWITLGILVIGWFAFRKKPQIRVWMERLVLLPISYTLGHVIVKGFHSISYAAQRDFVLIIAAAALIFCGLFLIHSLVYHGRELRQS